jgi:hypothetical protein
MGIATHQRPVATAWTALLLVGAVLVLLNLARVMFLDLAGSNRPSDRRCAELWNGPANQTNRSLVSGRRFPLATVRGIDPNKAGQQGCGVLLRERADGPWLSFGAVSPRPRCSGILACPAFGTGPTARPATGTTLPTRRCRRMGVSYSATASRHGAVAPSTRACQRGKWSAWTGLTLWPSL